MLKKFLKFKDKLFAKLLMISVISFVPMLLMGYFYFGKLEVLLMQQYENLIQEKAKSIANSVVSNKSNIGPAINNFNDDINDTNSLKFRVQINRELFDKTKKQNNEQLVDLVVAEDSDKEFLTNNSKQNFLVIDKKCQFLGSSDDAENNLNHVDICREFPMIASALKNKKQTKFNYFSKSKNLDIMASVLPIMDYDNNKIIGAVVIEDSLKKVQDNINDITLSLSSGLIITFFFSFFLLLVFISRLTGRIRFLTHETVSSIDNKGQILKTKLEANKWRDELGDLARSISNKLVSLQTNMKQLKEYNDYLLQYKDKLRHELQTPLSMAKTSLELLLMNNDLPKNAEEYVMQADKGLDRLKVILDAISESKNIEQAVTSEEKERINFTQLLVEYVEASNNIYPDSNIILTKPKNNIYIVASSWLIEQMLDKVLSNAVEFSKNNTDIEIVLTKHKGSCKLSIINQGELLTSTMQERIFDFMISVRESSDSKVLHLGLGLYISKLIANFHNGRISAKNLEDNKGVIIEIILDR